MAGPPGSFPRPPISRMPDLSLAVFAALTLAAFTGGFVSSIAGAGGMIVPPCLLWAGVPPVQAPATNKCQSVFGTLSSATNYLRKGLLELLPLRSILAWAFAGAVGGTLLVRQLDAALLVKILPLLLILLAGYFALSPRIADQDTPPRLAERLFAPLAGGGLGLYGGFFGPGLGSFAADAFAGLRGHNMRSATASSKPVILVTNLTSVVIFVVHGHVVWPLVASMALAQIAGACLGSNLAIAHGAGLIRPMIIAVTTAIALRISLR